MRRPYLVLAVIGGMVLLAGCAGQSAGDDAPARAMMAYLEARVASDEDRVRGLACAAWEAQAIRQAGTFSAMDAALQDVSCAVTGQQDEYTLVYCDGSIVTTYNGETREWPLGSFRMLQEDGEWKMCGEAE